MKSKWNVRSYKERNLYGVLKIELISDVLITNSNSRARKDTEKDNKVKQNLKCLLHMGRLNELWLLALERDY